MQTKNIQKFLQENKFKIIYYGLVILGVVNLIIFLTILWSNPNLFQLDTAGHIASGKFFTDLGMHSYNWHRFGGYINNLFYPPLEDAINSLITFFSHNPLLSYQIYGSVILLVYFFSFVLVSQRFKNYKIKIFFLILVLFLLNLEKNSTLLLQGLSYFDFLYTGLSSEFLGGIFLLLCVYELLGDKENRAKYIKISIYVFLGILSHIIVGPSLFLVVLVFAIYQKNSKLFWSLLIAVGLSSFFWIPFLVYKSNLISSTNLGDKSGVFFIVLLFLVALFNLILTLYQKNKKYFLLGIVSFLFILPQMLGIILTKIGLYDLIPNFHYYRFSILSLILGIIIFCGLLEEKIDFKQIKGKSIKIVLTLVWIIFYLFFFSFYTPQKYQRIVGPSDINLVNGNVLNLINDDKRILTIDHFRSIDFNLDAYLLSLGYDLHFVKGLFWESTKNSILLNSYLSTVLDVNTIITNRFLYRSPTCDQIKGNLDQFAKDYAIGRIIIPNNMREIGYFVNNEDKKKCFESLFAQGTNNLNLNFVGQFLTNKTTYSLYKLGVSSLLNNEMLEVYTNPSITMVTGEVKTYYHKIFKDNEKYLPDGKINTMLYVFDDTLFSENFEKSGSVFVSGDMRLESNGKRKINIHSDKNVLFQLKMNYFPGLHFYDQNGKEMEMYASAKGIIGVGKGEITLEYKKTSVYVVAYGLSMVSGVFVVFFLFFVTRKKYFQN